MDTCVFCKIIKGEFESAKVYEDDDVFAFLDVNPVSEGHCLVVPKRHQENIFVIDAEDLKAVMVASKKIAEKMKSSFKVDGVNFLQSNGKVAGQVIFHYHLHIIPRYENDGLKTRQFFGEREQGTDIRALKALAERIKL